MIRVLLKELLTMLLIAIIVGLIMWGLAILFWNYAPFEWQEAFKNAVGYVGQ